jgi:hypothetical protein
MIGVNPIATQNNTIVTFHLDDEECGSERRAPYGELHGDDASSLHWVTLHAVQCQVGSHDLIIFSSKLLEHRIWHHVDHNTAVDKHSRNRPRVNVTSNVQRLQALVPSWARWSSKCLSVLILEKLDVPVYQTRLLILLLLGTGPILGSNFVFLPLGLVLLHYNLLWTSLHASLCFVIG